MKKNYFTDQNVLTIDQCQGQEADYVILSLVQKPTRFLNKNRMNVALSRVRKRLFLIADRKDFKVASTNTSWDSSWIAKDLLELSKKEEKEDPIYGDYGGRSNSYSIYDMLNRMSIDES